MAVSVVFWPCTIASAEDPLFSTDLILEITIDGPLKKLKRSKSPSTRFTGRLELENGSTVPMELSKYGISRLEKCDLPLFKIEIDEAHADGTPFAGHRTVRMVTPCHHDSAYDRFILLEYLVYRSYGIITEPALRVRLASTRFLDSEKPAFEETGLSFFVEDIGAAAERNGMAWLDIEEQPIEGLSPPQLALFALFQYLVGNTDWSAASAAEGNRCCHNVAILGAQNDQWNTPLPYDFDHAGLVNAPYASPDRQLPIRSVTQRWYRGLCESNDSISAAIAIFNEKRPELDKLFNDDNLPDPNARKRALKYIDAFYETINDPRQVEKRILSSCR
jgi:hypothetical protein